MSGLKFVTLKSSILVEVYLLNIVIECSDLVTVSHVESSNDDDENLK